MRRLLHLVDLTTTANPLLARELVPDHGVSIWFPGPAPERRSTAAEGRDRVIVWLGSGSTQSYLSSIALVVEELRAQQWRCVAVGATDEAQAYGWEVVQWNPAAEAHWLSRSSIGVMPQPTSDWADRKAAYKLLEYAASGVVPVASNVPPARVLLEGPMLSPLLVGDAMPDWLAAIRYADEHRDQLKAALSDLSDRFSVARILDQWEAAVQDLVVA
jgi:glycosyltransferase involved in cell wall biosynthesis